MGSWGVSEQAWRKGPWTPEEDKLLVECVSQNGEGRWSSVSECTGLKRSGKSCRLRWVNYLRPGLKKGHLTAQEEGIIMELHAIWGNKWSTIARYLPGRTDNEIKNYWRTQFKKRKPCGNHKQEKRKSLRQKQQEEESDHYSNVSESLQATKSTDEGNCKKETEIIENDHQMLPLFCEDFWLSDFIPVDWCLWGGLWDLGDPMGVENGSQLANVGNSSWEGDAYVF